MSTAWKELLKKPYLSQKPQLTQGLADYNEDRDLSLAFKNLTDLEDHCKKLYKEVRRHEECANGLHRQSSMSQVLKKLERSCSAQPFGQIEIGWFLADSLMKILLTNPTKLKLRP